MTTIQIENFGETLQVRCNLTEASSPVEVNYMTGDGWTSTQWQCADCRHMWGQLANLGARLLASACGESYEHEDASYQYSEVVLENEPAK